ncbi:YciI family protein [Arcanobacterium hippocoleae]|uniref:Uncharacterized protein YciI n=1 Tax=Arcanobacterium hippocoleae TaxID=149017 RepID=A0ABU1T0B5_9ACTO|nr:YciI family protein [Arcanobacterium hippocoleae]MDR6938804.1 uncharacterized protein YciI [Arcanobacterium hippocoleae]
MNIIAVNYVYDPEKSAELNQHRPAHREFLRSLFDAAQLLASGPLGTDEALIIVRAESPESALEILAADPLYEADIILKRTAQPWNPVIGPWE